MKEMTTITRRLAALVLAVLLIVMLLPAALAAPADPGGGAEHYVLMNIPYADFYAAELNSDVTVDAVTSATLNKPRTGTLAGGSYHVNADGSDITGVIYPVRVEDLSVLADCTEITDESSVDITVTNRGNTTTTTYSGKDALFESPSYSYYTLAETPARYKTLTVNADGSFAFSAVSGQAATVEGVTWTAEYNTHHNNFVEIELSNTEGIARGDAVSGAILTFDDGSAMVLRHVVNIWRATGIGGDNAEEFAGKNITNVRYYTQTAVIDYPVNISVKEDGGAITAAFDDANTLTVTGLPADIANPMATVQSQVGRGETPTVIAENVAVTDGKITTTDAAVGGTAYTVSITSDNYADLSASATCPQPVGETFLSQVIGTYQPLFEGATLNSEYDHYWNDYTAAIVGASAAADTVAYMKSAINAPGYGDTAVPPNFYCGFVNDVATITFGGEDGKTVTFTKEDGSSVTHTYAFVREAAATGQYGDYPMEMPGYLYQAQDGADDAFEYLLMFPDTPDTTYHLEFRYAGTEEDVLALLDGAYAYWVGSAIRASALTEENEDTLQKVISLFVAENLAGNETAETKAQRVGLVGTWDCDFSAFPEYGNAKMYIVLSADGTGKTYADFTGSGTPSLTAEYTFFAFDPDQTDGKDAGTYIALNPAAETVTPGEYEIKAINGQKALVFTSNEGVITYYLRAERQSGGGSSRGSSVVNTGSSAVSVNQVQNGTAQPSSSTAKAGDTVTITVTPDEGYQVTGVTAKDKNGNVIPVMQNANGTYSFTMPNTPVTITPTFEKIADQPGTDVSDRFTDVARDAWYHDAVQWAVDKGIMNGVAPDLFDPDGTATRAMVVTMLWRLAGEPAAAGSDFSDVTGDSWYADAVAWAASTGAVNGMSADTFAPDAEITREQLATILYRYAQSQGKGFTGAWAFPLDYPDAGDVSDWAYEAMCWMTMNGIIQGMDDGTLDPGANATRAQIATMFQRFCEALES